MSWKIWYLPEADKDYRSLDGSQRLLVDKALKKVQQNPLPQREGGYGKELANQSGLNLAGLLKVKIKSAGIRIVYKLERTDNAMLVIVIGMRADNEVYKTAYQRIVIRDFVVNESSF